MAAPALIRPAGQATSATGASPPQKGWSDPAIVALGCGVLLIGLLGLLACYRALRAGRVFCSLAERTWIYRAERPGWFWYWLLSSAFSFLPFVAFGVGLIWLGLSQP